MEIITRTDGIVSITMTRDEAEKLFHAANRTMSILDDCMNHGDLDDTSDRAAYDDTNDFLATMQRQLQFEPEKV